MTNRQQVSLAGPSDLDSLLASMQPNVQLQSQAQQASIGPINLDKLINDSRLAPGRMISGVYIGDHSRSTFFNYAYRVNTRPSKANYGRAAFSLDGVVDPNVLVQRTPQPYDEEVIQVGLRTFMKLQGHAQAITASDGVGAAVLLEVADALNHYKRLTRRTLEFVCLVGHTEQGGLLPVMEQVSRANTVNGHLAEPTGPIFGRYTQAWGENYLGPNNGDPYNWRGRGIIQLTWRKLYEMVTNSTGYNFLDYPDSILTVRGAAWSTVAYMYEVRAGWGVCAGTASSNNATAYPSNYRMLTAGENITSIKQARFVRCLMNGGYQNGMTKFVNGANTLWRLV